jgi:uncharacterized glyoxalase superfamily protein PhnB
LTAPKLEQLNIVSRDLEATVRFYRLIGLPMDEPHRTPAGEPFHASSGEGDGVLLEADSPAFARVWNQGWQGEAELDGRVVIGLRVETRDEVDRLYREVIGAGYRGLQPPFDAFWGARYAIVEDPNGLAVGLMSPADDAHRAAPTLP